MSQVIGLGAVCHAKVMIQALRLSGDHQIVGLLDPKPVGRLSQP